MCRSPDSLAGNEPSSRCPFCLWHFLDCAHIPPLYPDLSVLNRHRVWTLFSTSASLHCVVMTNATCHNFGSFWDFLSWSSSDAFRYDNRFTFQLKLARLLSGLCNHRLFAFLHIFKSTPCWIKTMPGSSSRPPSALLLSCHSNPSHRSFSWSVIFSACLFHGMS